MSRWEFMRRLEELLSDISPNEREEALQYYNDYFNDAGRENEKEVIEALGSPEQVAKIVKDGLSENACQGEFTETGFNSAKNAQQNAIIKRREESSEKQNSFADEGNAGKAEENSGKDAGREEGRQPDQKEPMPTWAIVLIVIGCVLLSPVILSFVCAAGGVLLGIIAAILGVILGFGLAMIICYVVAAVLFVAGFGCIIVHPVSAMGLLGGGCILVALGIVFMLLTGFLAGKCVPGICQGIAYIFKKIFGKKEVSAA
ncbi:MAG: DUF1700 domain-containing protein [Lachnospiraceae bacterium]|nr:DUF1700 domain-containing protein [Lachnospiraceae bacterium]